MKNYDFVRIDFLSFYKGFGAYTLEIFCIVYHEKYSGALLTVTWNNYRKYLHVYFLWLFSFHFGNVPDSVKYLEERAARGDRTKFEEVLSKIRSVEPNEEDCWQVLGVGFDEEGGHCYTCGSELQIVRPGKYQCPECG